MVGTAYLADIMFIQFFFSVCHRQTLQITMKSYRLSIRYSYLIDQIEKNLKLTTRKQNKKTDF